MEETIDTQEQPFLGQLDQVIEDTRTLADSPQKVQQEEPKEDPRVKILELLKLAAKNNKKLQGLLSGESALEDYQESIQVLATKHHEKLTQIVNILAEIQPVQTKSTAVVTGEAVHPSLSSQLIQRSQKNQGGLKMLNNEYFPNIATIRIYKTLKPMDVPLDIEDTTEDDDAKPDEPQLELEGPYQVVVNGPQKEVYGSYIGEVKDGQWNGSGRLVFDNGNILEGKWKDGKLNGPGRVISWKGFYHEGNFKDGMPHGKCVEKFLPQFVNQPIETGYTYEGKIFVVFQKIRIFEIFGFFSVFNFLGEFVNGLYEGHGKKIYFGGDYYEGDFKAGRRHGVGTETYDCEATQYEGSWTDEKKNGQGRETYRNGDTYEGNFANNFRNGRGVYQW